MLLDLRLPVDIIEEGEQVEGKFCPALPLTPVQGGSVHDGRGVVQAWRGHDGTVTVPETTIVTSYIPCHTLTCECGKL